MPGNEIQHMVLQMHTLSTHRLCTVSSQYDGFLYCIPLPRVATSTPVIGVIGGYLHNSTIMTSYNSLMDNYNWSKALADSEVANSLHRLILASYCESFYRRKQTQTLSEGKLASQFMASHKLLYSMLCLHVASYCCRLLHVKLYTGIILYLNKCFQLLTI